MKRISTKFDKSDRDHRAKAWEWLKGVLVLTQLGDTFEDWEIAETEEDALSDKINYTFTRE